MRDGGGSFPSLPLRGLVILATGLAGGSGCGSTGSESHTADAGDAGPAERDASRDVEMARDGGGEYDGGRTTDGGGADCDETPTAREDEDGPLDEGTTVGELTSYGTIHSLGFEWNIEGDSNHNATVSVRYRKRGACRFERAYDLLRNDYAYRWHVDPPTDPVNNFAGSLMFLTPGTTYEVVLELSDPDGGRATRIVEIATRPVPTKPTGGRTWHVVPGSGGGDGSEGSPFEGIGAADAAVQPGDIVLLHAGNYSGTHALTSSGEAGNRIVWQPAGDGDVTIGAVDVRASHLWLDGLTFEPDGQDIALDVDGATTNVVVTQCRFTGYLHAIHLNRDASGWIITDNTIVGNKAEGVGLGSSGDYTGEGVELRFSSGHVVAYNRISRTADGVGAGLRNNDVYGNDIFDTSDDGIEPDHGRANIRVWGNRIHDVAAYSISFQPQELGPWYFIRNQMAGAGHGVFKWIYQDRFVFIHNTVVRGVPKAQYLMKSVSRNNLYVPPAGGPVWTSTDAHKENEFRPPPQWEPSWNTDVDHDGFDWGDATTAFTWRDNSESYPDLDSFSEAVGIEEHGVCVDKNVIFEDFFAGSRPVPRRMLTLNPGTNAVDTGGVLPNLADVYAGEAPDLGAYEVGRPPPHYGPRTGDTVADEAYWAWH